MPAKKLSPHLHLPEILQKSLSPRETSLKCLQIQEKELPPLLFFAPCGIVSHFGKSYPPFPSFPSAGAVPDCPPQKGNLGRLVPVCPPGRANWDEIVPDCPPEGQSGTILGRGGHSGTLSASVPGCPPLLLITSTNHGYHLILQK